MHMLLALVVILGAEGGTPSATPPPEPKDAFRVSAPPPLKTNTTTLATNTIDVATSSTHALHARHPPHRAGVFLQPPPPRRVPPPLVGATRVVYGYLPYWEYGPESVPWEHLTHLAVFSVGANADGSLSNLSRWTGRAADAVRLGHAAGVQVELCVTQFDSDTLDSILGSSSARGTLARNLATQVSAFGADGVNVDFEGVRGRQRTNLVTFVRELKAAGVGNVSLATPAVDWNDAWDWAALSDVADGLFIMGYGYHWTGGDPGPNAPLEDGDTWSQWTLSWTVQDMLSGGADPAKIIVGLPLYGQSWPVSSPTTVPGNATGSGSSIVYTDAVANAASRGRRWDSDSSTPWYAGSSSQTWYDDAESVEIKVRWALLDAGVGGFGFWALGYDGNDPDLWDRLDRAVADAAIADTPVDTGTTDTAPSDTDTTPTDTALPPDTDANGGSGADTIPGAKRIGSTAGCLTVSGARRPGALVPLLVGMGMMLRSKRRRTR